MSGLTSFDPDVVRDFLRDWERWFDEGRHEAMARYYAEDARLVATSTPTIIGRANVDRFMRAACEWARESGARRTVKLEQAESAGDIGYMRGTVLLAMPSDPQPSTVRYTTLWKRMQSGHWQLIEDISCAAPPGRIAP